MKRNTIPTLILFFILINKIYAQELSAGVVSDFLFHFKEIRTEYIFNVNGDIDKDKTFSMEREINNFNSFGVDFRINFIKMITTGIQLTYGEKVTSDYQLANYHFKRTIALISIQVPVLYSYQFNELLFLEIGLNVGYISGKYIEEYNIANPYTLEVEDRKDDYYASQFTFSPTINVGTNPLNNLEFLIVFKYALNSQLKFDDLRWDNVESIIYDFNGFSLGFIVNYVF